ncbi:MAG TPA: hypothetical protein VF006_04515 [Longimicrobium sp.]
MMNRGFSLPARLALLLACALPVGGCNAIGDLILGERYDGPQPAAEGINNEVAVVRLVEVVPSGQTVLLIDRTRFVAAGDPHNVNRVARVASGEEMRQEVAALNLARGDQVVISTDYQGTVNVIGSNSVPDWPGHTAYEYPIGFHAITAIARAGN